MLQHVDYQRHQTASKVVKRVLTVVGARPQFIKEIIFGNNIREYEKEFAEIREFININFTAVDKEIAVFKKHIDDLEKKLFAPIEANHKELSDKIDSLNEKKMDRRKLGNYCPI